MSLDKTAPFRNAAAAIPQDAAPSRSVAADYLELTKPRLSLMSVITALVAYLVAGAGDALSFFSLLSGTALAAGGAAALNQYMERDADARMLRTRDRPLPAGRVTPNAVLLYGVLLSLGGVLLLTFGCNLLAGVLTLATVVSYLMLYTPLKRITPRATEIGALPGALPPLIGWVAATGSIGPMGLFLFGVLFTWQMPHFMAISWMCRDDYARGGFRMLSIDDGSGSAPGRVAVLWSSLLLLLSAWPLFTGHADWLYAAFGPLLCAWMLWESVRFLRSGKKNAQARRLFFVSIAFLPLYLLVLLSDYFL